MFIYSLQRTNSLASITKLLIDKFGIVHSMNKLQTRKMMKKILLILCLSTLLAGCSDDEVGDVSLGLFTTKDIKLNMLVDPIVTGVTCHVASIEADLSLSDPSDSSIACRQTGEITPEMIAAIDNQNLAILSLRNPKVFSLKP